MNLFKKDFLNHLIKLRGNSVVECLTVNQDIAGSNPASEAIKKG